MSKNTNLNKIKELLTEYKKTELAILEKNKELESVKENLNLLATCPDCKNPVKLEKYLFCGPNRSQLYYIICSTSDCEFFTKPAKTKALAWKKYVQHCEKLEVVYE